MFCTKPCLPPAATVMMTLSCFSCDPAINLTSCCGVGESPPTPRCTSHDWTVARDVAPTSLQIKRRSLRDMTPVPARCLGWRSGSRCITSARTAPLWDMARRDLHGGKEARGSVSNRPWTKSLKHIHRDYTVAGNCEKRSREETVEITSQVLGGISKVDVIGMCSVCNSCWSM